MIETEILENLRQLPDSLQQEVLHYVKFLKARYAPETTSSQKKRQAGRLKGKIIMAEDFDAPLEEFKDYM
ncbi:MAG: DUF2281 domain-containing protein [Plectolyngbya sp. WJT66-NPBG17]|jgi:translation initiation factor 2 beta subunit (eIF-2beta)/eIF-5|nr:DUF2281 domain-containing protein [Plectolyngbya sp. WJT66-NPBG17]MBW4526519.1 DUF2281 domain-containing protein [Phormidium tanganyikae FI6-MK23]